MRMGVCVRAAAMAVGVAGVSVFGLASGAEGAVVYSTGFEAPVFAAGDIVGQDAWGLNPFSLGTGTVQSATVHSGSQALRVSGQELSTYVDRAINLPVTGQVVTIEVDFMAMDHGAGATHSGLGVWAPGDDFVAQLSLINVLYTLGNTNSDTSLPGVAYEVWHHFALTLNFDTMMMSATVDGNPLVSIAINNTVTPTSIERVSLFTQGSGGDAFFDNLVVSSIAVPAPGSVVGVAALLGAGMVRRRRW